MLNTLKVLMEDILHITLFYHLSTRNTAEHNIYLWDAEFYSWFCTARLSQAESPIRSNCLMSRLIDKTKHRQSRNHYLASCSFLWPIEGKLSDKIFNSLFKSPNYSEMQRKIFLFGKNWESRSRIPEIFSYKKSLASGLHILIFIFVLNIDYWIFSRNIFNFQEKKFP